MNDKLLEKLKKYAELADSDGVSDEAQTVREAIEILEENRVLWQWNNDLMSGMYVNCVYCGHRYGPVENTPTSMADILKEHIEKCSKHPMSKLKAIVDRLRNAELTQRALNMKDDIVLLNGEPVGEQIYSLPIQFDKFWDAIKNKILGKDDE